MSDVTCFFFELGFMFCCDVKHLILQPELRDDSYPPPPLMLLKGLSWEQRISAIFMFKLHVET